MSWLELGGAAITIVSIWLATRENVWYYPTGIISVVLYAWIYFGARLYAESGLQVVWLVLMLYGWYEWLHGGAGRRELPVTRTPRRAWWLVIVSGAALTAVIVSIQTNYTNNPAPLVDSGITAWSIVGQWMTARKWIESWLFWMVVNAIAVPLCIARELWFTAALCLVLLGLAVVGYRNWSVTLRRA